MPGPSRFVSRRGEMIRVASVPPVEKLFYEIEMAYNDNQARWPRGHPLGGQWRGDGFPVLNDAGAPKLGLKQKAQLFIAKSKAQGDTKNGKAPTKAQIGKYLPLGHPMKPVRKARAKKVEQPVVLPPAPVAPAITHRPITEARLAGKLKREPDPTSEPLDPYSWDAILARVEGRAVLLDPTEFWAKDPGTQSPKVSAKFKTEKLSGEHDEKLKRVLSAIDKVHGDGKLRPIYINTNKNIGRSNGNYERSGQQHWDEINISPRGETPHLTMAHEIGHFLDYRMLGTGRGEYGGSGNLKSTKEMRDLMSAINNSGPLKEIVENVTNDMEIRRFGAYLSSPHESFARAYAQYIALRSGDIDMAKDMQKRLIRDQTAPFRAQWSAREFEPIANAFDRLFKAGGYA